MASVCNEINSYGRTWTAWQQADMFTVEVLTLTGLRRYFVLFVIELKSRRVKTAGRMVNKLRRTEKHWYFSTR